MVDHLMELYVEEDAAGPHRSLAGKPLTELPNGSVG